MIIRDATVFPDFKPNAPAAMKQEVLQFLNWMFAQGRGGGGGGPESFRFRAMGPAVGNRISAAAGIPGDPTTYYVGAASGDMGRWVEQSRPGATVTCLDIASHLEALGGKYYRR